MSAAFELAGVLGAGLGASYLLAVVVEKARKCLDLRSDSASVSPFLNFSCVDGVNATRCHRDAVAWPSERLASRECTKWFRDDVVQRR